MAGPAAKLRGLFHSPGPMHTDGTPKNDYNRKFKPPDKHPLQMEDDLKEMIPLNHRRKAAFENTLKRTANNAMDLEVVRTAKRMLTELKIYDTVDEFDEEHAKDFMFWLAGRSRLNHPRITPWGSKDLFHLPEVWQYFRSYIDKREEFRKALMELYFECRTAGPSGLKQSYLYYKYLAEEYENYHDKATHGRLNFEDPKRYPFYTMDQMLHFLDIWKQPEYIPREHPKGLSSYGCLGSNQYPVVRRNEDDPKDESKFLPGLAGYRTNNIIRELDQAIDVRHLDAPEFKADRLRDPGYEPEDSKNISIPIAIQPDGTVLSVEGNWDDPHIQKAFIAAQQFGQLQTIVHQLGAMDYGGRSGTALIHNAVAEGNANIAEAIRELKRSFKKRTDLDQPHIRELEKEIQELTRLNEQMQADLARMQQEGNLKELEHAYDADQHRRNLQELQDYIGRLQRDQARLERTQEIERIRREERKQAKQPPPLPDRVTDTEIDEALKSPLPTDTDITVKEAKKLILTGRESPINGGDETTEEYLVEDDDDPLFDDIDDNEPSTPSGTSEPPPSSPEPTPASKPQKDQETLNIAAHKEAKTIAKEITEGQAPDTSAVREWTRRLGAPKDQTVIADLVAGRDWLLNSVLPLAQEEKKRYDEYHGEAAFDLSPALRNYLRLVTVYKQKMARGALLERNWNSKRYLAVTRAAEKKGNITADQSHMALQAFRWFEDSKKRAEYSNGISPLDEIDTLLRDMGHEVPYRKKAKSPSKSPSKRVTIEDEPTE